MRLIWYGHACFRLEADGLSIVTDPYTPDDAGLEPIRKPADVVVMSSALDDAHSYWQQVPGDPRVVNALDAVSRTGGARAGRRRRGRRRPRRARTAPTTRRPTRSTASSSAGSPFCHMGDVGTPLAEAQLAPLRGRVDVLLALAGGGLTIALPDLDDAIEAIGPKVVVPMHHRTPSLKYDVGPVEDFLARRGGDRVVTHDGQHAEARRRPAARDARDPRPAGGVRPTATARRLVMAGWELGLIDSVWQGSELDGLPGHRLAREIGYDTLDLFVGFDPGTDPVRRQKVIDDARASELPVRSVIATCLGLNDFNTAVREYRDPASLQRGRPGVPSSTASATCCSSPASTCSSAACCRPSRSGPGWSTRPAGSAGTPLAAGSRWPSSCCRSSTRSSAPSTTSTGCSQEVGLPNVKAAIDISHLWLERIEPSRLADFAGRIAHVHIADCDGENHGDLPPGRGTTPFPAYLEALREAGFDGTAAVELEFPVDGAPLRDWVTEAYGTSSRLLADAGVRT